MMGSRTSIPPLLREGGARCHFSLYIDTRYVTPLLPRTSAPPVLEISWLHLISNHLLTSERSGVSGSVQHRALQPATPSSQLQFTITCVNAAPH